MTSTFFGPAAAPGIFPRTPEIQRSTLRRQPSGCAFTQINPRERRLTICSGIVEARNVSATGGACPSPEKRNGHLASRVAVAILRRILNHLVVFGFKVVL